MGESLAFKGRRVLVTGAGGFIGSHLVERLLQEGAHVTAFLRYTSRGQRGYLYYTPANALDDTAVVFGDIRDFPAVADLVRKAEVVFHLAALVGIPYSYRHPQEVIDTNCTGTSNVLLAARESDRVERVVLTSTSEVYGSARYVPMDEDHPLQPQSPYAATKIAADALGLSFHRSFGMPVSIVRPFNSYGPRQSARAVIPAIIAQAVHGENLRLGSTNTSRDFTFVTDTVEGFLRVATADACIGEVVNIGSGMKTSIAEVIRLVGEITGRELTAQTDEQRLRPKASEVSELQADASKAKRLAGWQAQVPLTEGLRRTADWIRAHRELYEPEVYAV